MIGDGSVFLSFPVGAETKDRPRPNKKCPGTRPGLSVFVDDFTTLKVTQL